MIILASASPRRRELLGQICSFEVRATDCDESCALTSPEEFVCELSRRKVLACKADFDDIVIGADTVVAIDGEILGKPRDPEDAKAMLAKLSGKTHSVFTGVTVVAKGESHTFCERTDVTFFELSRELIDWYVGTDEPLDKAGAYGIQEKGCVLVKGISGDYFNVVGLPVARLYRILNTVGGTDTDA
ncbi:MAG: septum formation protein Maf [Clostridia bacterium]|nr:septum formation protein Maf [Clostridia bacterium]